jgi:hypothetical protein
MKLLNYLKGLFKGSQATPATDTDIDQIESATINLINLIKKIVELSKDGSLKGDWFAISKAAIPLIQNARKWQELKGEIINFDVGKGKMLAENLSKAGVMPEKVDIVVLNAIAAIEKSVVLYNTNIVPIIQAVKK